MSDLDEDSGFPTLLLYALLLAAAAFLLRRYFKGAQFKENASGKDKVFVITGANSGIGFETARELCLRKGKVYMLCRSEDRANEARQRLVRMGCDASRLLFLPCDLTSFSSVRQCAEQMGTLERHIDVLINNAAVMFYPRWQLTEDKHETTWQTNYLGAFLLSALLLPLLRAAPTGGRVVNVAAAMHKQVKSLDLDKIDEKKAFGRLAAYNKSKLASIMHAREMARRLHAEGTHNVTINSVHPGVCETNLGRSLFLLSKTPFKQIVKGFSWLFVKTARDGAQTPLYLALSKKVDGISGKYFSDCALSAESPLARDDPACARLFEYSIKQCGLEGKGL